MLETAPFVMFSAATVMRDLGLQALVVLPAAVGDFLRLVICLVVRSA